MNDRRNDPSADGAWIPPNSVGIAPCPQQVHVVAAVRRELPSRGAKNVHHKIVKGRWEALADAGGVPQPAPDLRAGIAVPRSVRASEGCPQLFGKSAVSAARDLVYGGSLVSSESSG